MTFRSYPNGFPQLRPVSPLATVKEVPQAIIKPPTRLDYAVPSFPAVPSSLMIQPASKPHQQALTPSLLRAYGAIYERLGGELEWQDNQPFLNPQLYQRFLQVREHVAQGTKIEIAMYQTFFKA